jgi:hypothetical protein
MITQKPVIFAIQDVFEFLETAEIFLFVLADELQSSRDLMRIFLITPVDA